MSVVHRSSLRSSLSGLLCCLLLAMSAMVRPAECQAGVSNLFTGFDIGQQIAKAALTGTVFNPSQFQERFEALHHLTSLFDLQDKVHHQLQVIKPSSENGAAETLSLHDDYLVLTSMDVFLERMIMDSCHYINWTLSDFYSNSPICCDGFTPSRLTFNCSRDAAELLQLKLKFWLLNRNVFNNFMSNGCYRSQGCSIAPRSRWVSALNLNSSDTTEANIQNYLNCII